MRKTAHRMKHPVSWPLLSIIYNENCEQECGISDDCISISVSISISISSSKSPVIQKPFQTKNATSIVVYIGRSVVLIIGTPLHRRILCAATSISSARFESKQQRYLLTQSRHRSRHNGHVRKCRTSLLLYASRGHVEADNSMQEKPVTSSTLIATTCIASPIPVRLVQDN